MAVEQQPWLISYEYRPYELIPGRGQAPHDVARCRGEACRTVALIRIPPWKFLAGQRMQVQAADRGQLDADARRHGGLLRVADDISAVFWAVQVPFFGLTDFEMESLQ